MDMVKPDRQSAGKSREAFAGPLLYSDSCSRSAHIRKPDDGDHGRHPIRKSVGIFYTHPSHSPDKFLNYLKING